jgi:hypothetical protein
VARSQAAADYMSQISASPIRSVTGIAAHRTSPAAAPTLAKIPPAVQNPETLPSQQPVETPALKLPVSPAPKLADNKLLPDTHLTSPYVPDGAFALGQPIRLPPVEGAAGAAPQSAIPDQAGGAAQTAVHTQIVAAQNVDAATDREIDGSAIAGAQPAAAKAQPAVTLTVVPQDKPAVEQTPRNNVQSARRFLGRTSPAKRETLARNASDPTGPALAVPARVAPGVAPNASRATEKRPAVAIAPALPAVQPPVAQVVRAVRPRGKVPPSLDGRLESLAYECDTGPWAMDAQGLLARLDLAIKNVSPERAAILDQLDALIAAAEPLATQIDDWQRASQFRRTSYALARRVVVWKQALLLAQPAMRGEPQPAFDAGQLAVCLDRIDAIAKKAPAMGAWKTYLLCDALRELASNPKACGSAEGLQLAERVLDRLLRVPLDQQQQAFINGEAISGLRAVLARAVAGSVDVGSLLERLERFEQSGAPAEAQSLADDCRRLSVSPRAEVRRLGQQLDSYYRNANIRVVVSQTLLNRLIPPQGPEYTDVNDTILGVPVAGQAVNTSALAVQFIPTPDHLRLALQVSGRIHSETAANAGPATFYNSGDAEYSASKAMEIDADGIKLAPAEVAVDSRAQLREVRTQFDGIPLIGSLAQSVARSQQEQSLDQANQETQGKISARAKQRIDSEAYAKVYEFTQNVRRRIYQPLADLSLRPTMISAQTTEERMAMRLRLAADDELAAFTPRPRAPADSLASLQLHESAVNNMLEKLELDGRTATLPELSRYVAGRLNRPAPWNIDPAHDDVTVSFAPKNAISVRFQNGQAALTLAIARFSKGSRSWRDFQVRVCYRPQVEGRSAELVRDGTIQLSGARLNGSGQIALRGAFSKVFPKNTAFKLTPQRFLTDPSLSDVAITQFVIEDGWLGAALGPTHVSQAAAPTNKQLSAE